MKFSRPTWEGKWAPFAAAFWALLAIYLPQLALRPVVPVIVSLPLTQNARLFTLQMIIQLLTLGMIHLVLKKWYKRQWADIGLGKAVGSQLKWGVIAFPVYVCATLITTAILQTIQPLQSQLQAEQQLGYAKVDGIEQLLVFAALVVVAPLIEEIIFRGFLFTVFRKHLSFLWTTLIVSLLFAAAHGQLNVGFDVFVLSFFLCYLREKTGSLWPSILLHSLKNLVAFVYVFIIS